MITILKLFVVDVEFVVEAVESEVVESVVKAVDCWC